jgi:cystathionine beta-lyase/cystathionine gamma-synthase
LQEKLLAEMGARARFVDVADLSAVAAALREERPAALVCEIVSNPLLKVADLPALAALAHEAGAALVVDATFATPYLCRPLELGADYVVHSATKYLAGHGDVLAGVVACSAARALDLSLRQRLLGANLGPQEPGWPYAGSRPCRCACASSAPTPPRWLPFSPRTPPWRRSTIPACPATRSTSFAGASTAAAATAP